MATSSKDSAPAKPSGGLRAAIEAALPKARFGDQLTILSGTGQNIAGLAVFVLASLATNIFIARTQGARSLGVVTLATQLAFIGGAATRFGMDMAAVRLVAIDIGKGERGRVRGVVREAVLVAAVVSAVVAVVIFLGAGQLVDWLLRGGGSSWAFRAAGIALPFVALCQVYLGGSRGLKIMRHTLYAYWIGQPVSWIGLLIFGWIFEKAQGGQLTVGWTVNAYAISWIIATVAAAFFWNRTTKDFGHTEPEPGQLSALIRYGAPRAPAALLSQALFWTDFFVAAKYVNKQELGVYAASVRVSQALVLFLIAVNYMFSPFVADLHERGEREKLDGLYKALTRWMLAGTIPLLLLILVVPGPILLVFGGNFASGTTALRILLIGQLINVAVGSVGFILIMVGRTGWDLAVYAGSFVLDLVVAFALCPSLGTKGAAIAQAITLAVSNGVRLYLVWRFVHIQPFNKYYFRLAIPAGVTLLAMAATHLVLRHAAWPVDLLGTGIVGGFVYFTMMLLTGFTPTEKGALMRLLGRSAPATS
ncbi:MAG: polysaccharide biosynthesis C-terminal domain-containing protein [Actinomycetota bacterium]